MKALVCEMCTSHDIVKEGDYYVCQSCGTKYTVEAAKKMMVEVDGKVDVSGSTVKVDKSAELNSLYEIARRAKKENNRDQAARYYDMILQQDPKSWEAYFYSNYYSAMQTNIAGITNAAYRVNNTLKSTMELIKSEVPEAERGAAVSEVTVMICNLAKVMADSALSHYNQIDVSIKYSHQEEAVGRLDGCKEMCYNCGSLIEAKFANDPACKRSMLLAWKQGVALAETKESVFYSTDVLAPIYKEKIFEYDADYKKAELNKKLESLNLMKLSIETVRAGTEKNRHTPRKGWLAFGIVILIVAIGLFVLGYVSHVRVWQTYGAVFGLLFAALGIAGIAISFPKKSMIEKQLKEYDRKMTEVDSEIADVETELAALK